ncbi:hypothetical protein FHS18_005129 [Paenibacillus phyllosphaerae]|uniref:Uncharacterized protein n=1 Tax=Paenibacillus phyllosphaerae TaxID=274593 RepID=A0A7W5B343_9BACL|nr:hypothetical protein [Paenibacillus phyllosphaerae]MBB3113026.1 hypothetical protein [Paenibacillus phyllosphaerae]
MKIFKKSILVAGVLAVALSLPVSAFAQGSKYVDFGIWRNQCGTSTYYSDADGYSGVVYLYDGGGWNYNGGYNNGQQYYCKFAGTVYKP